MEKLAKQEEWKGGRMGASSVELGVSQPIVTKGWSLPAGYVIHVAGPQLERGTEVPTEEEERLLAESYERSLDLAVEVSFDLLFFPSLRRGSF
jgi:O-acetyl-ADP-ribose deacetylase (regulator of RNase III)